MTATSRPPAGLGSLAPGCLSCGGRLEPGTDGNGGTVDRCRKCGLTPTQARRKKHEDEDSARSSPRAATGVGCAVSGCPGPVIAGRCECCERRNAWLARYAVKRTCAICGGSFSSKQNHRKYCDACATSSTQKQRSMALRAKK